MAQELTRRRAHVLGDLVRAGVVLVATASAGFLAARTTGAQAQDRYFLWIVGRSLGLGACASLSALVILGLWFRHPWRLRLARPAPHAETLLRLHAAFGMTTVLLIVGHVAALAADRYAGVGLGGAFVPGAATYRPAPVALGVVGAYAVVAIVLTAAFGGRIVGRRWLTVHRSALGAYGLVWLHGVLAGSDTPRLRAAYALSGMCIAVLATTGYMARPARDPVRDPARALVRTPARDPERIVAGR